jgi:hypothetical protein
LPPESQILILGRALPRDLTTLAAMATVARIGPAELAFTADETAAVLELAGASIDPAGAARLRLVTEGWPIAVHLAAERLAAAPDPGLELDRLEETSTLLARLLERPLDELPADARAAVVQVAHLTEASVAVAEHATGVTGVVELAIGVGVPFEADADGRIGLPDPVRELLVSRAPLDRAVGARAAEAYLERRRGAERHLQRAQLRRRQTGKHHGVDIVEEVDHRGERQAGFGVGRTCRQHALTASGCGAYPGFPECRLADSGTADDQERS